MDLPELRKELANRAVRDDLELELGNSLPALTVDRGLQHAELQKH